jgi:hypothetical protein
LAQVFQLFLKLCGTAVLGGDFSRGDGAQVVFRKEFFRSSHPDRFLRPRRTAPCDIERLQGLCQQSLVERRYRERANADLEPMRGPAALVGVMLHVP